MEAVYQKNISSTIDSDIVMKRSFAEFFAGIGLMRLGLEAAGWKIAFANDISEDKFEMYDTHFHDAEKHFVLSDIHRLPPDRIPSVTLATASFPCTDLSLAGMRTGLGGKQSSAYWGFVNLLEQLEERRPPIVLLENVVGFLTSHKGNDFLMALRALNQLGYAVDAFIVDAERFVPQSRVRLFVVGKQSPATMIRDTPGFYESKLRPKALADFILAHPQISWDLRELPEPPQRSIVFENMLETLRDDADYWWSRDRVEYLLSQMSPKHRNELEAMKKGRSWSYATAFRRVRNGKSMAELRTDGVAGCLRTPKGGSARQILIQTGYDKVKVRLLLPIECARLMGADGYKIATTQSKALFGFGDAVCVPVVSWIAENYLNPLVDEILLSAYN